MITRIDFLEHGGKTCYEYAPSACGYCSLPPKEVLQELVPKFQVASYRNRNLCPDMPYCWFRSISIYDANNNKQDIKKEIFQQGWRIIKPKIIGISISPFSSIDQLLEKVEEEIGRWQYDNFYIITPARKLKADGYSEKIIKSIMKESKRRFSFSKLSRDYLKTIVTRAEQFSRNRTTNDNKEVSLTKIVNLLLNDEPLREMCEIFLSEADLNKEILKRYIINKGFYPK